mgnify:CR=1 FL=1
MTNPTQTFANLFSFQDFNIPSERGSSDSDCDDDDDGSSLPAFMRHPGAEIARRAEKALAALETPEVVAALPLAHRDVAWACARACVAMEMDFAMASDTCIAPPEFGTAASAGADYISHTYGEITCDAVDTLARVMFEGEGGARGASVVDLGSGLGKIAFQLAMIAPGAREMIGVELAKSRHDVAVKALAAIEGDAERKSRMHCPVRLVCGDVCDAHYRSATHAFANSLLFTSELKATLAAELHRCASLRMIVSTTEMPLPLEGEDEDEDEDEDEAEGGGGGGGEAEASPPAASSAGEEPAAGTLAAWTLRPERLLLSVSWDTSPSWDGFIYVRDA